ncbi:MAG: hypothetical protein JSR83_26915 [Proteobacteria bacterium]|nr:hypothetical protein [Pseudomonadota bacterium]
MSKLEQVKSLLSSISDPADRELAETIFFLGHALGSERSSVKESIVVLVHGIRTNAEWQGRVVKLLGDAGFKNTVPLGYGFLDACRFWFPFLTRRGPISKIARDLRRIRSDNEGVNISIVAHSFGTYILSEILKEETDIVFHRIQLCGSIINLNYRWDKVKAQVRGCIVNDVGTSDVWPVLAKALSWGYGPSGTFGFKRYGLTDRYIKCGHSDFFDDEHVKKYWLPFLIDGQVVQSEVSKEDKASYCLSLLSILPIKMILAFLLVSYFFGVGDLVEMVGGAFRSFL